MNNNWEMLGGVKKRSKKEIQCTLWSSAHLYLVNTNSYGQSFLHCMFEEPFCIQHNLEFKIIIFILNNQNKCWAIVKFALQKTQILKTHPFWCINENDYSITHSKGCCYFIREIHMSCTNKTTLTLKFEQASLNILTVV